MVTDAQSYLIWVPLAPALGALVNGVLGGRFPRWLVYTIACGSLAVSALCSAAIFSELLHLGGHGEHHHAPQIAATLLQDWINVGDIQLSIRFVADPLSGLMILLITWVGLLIHIYSIGYMSHDPSYARYFTYLNLFCFSMLVLVLGDSLPLLFVGWEGVGLCSYLLIGFWYTDEAKASAGKKAFIVNRIGDFGFIVAMLLLFASAGTLSFEGLVQAEQAGLLSGVLTGACLMLILGCTGKSAQIPLFVWLPDAMAGPTPVSALIHAATMVTAGIYLVCRTAFLFVAAPTALLVLACIGALTALFAATIAVAQNDIKKVLAYSTVSQLGFMFLGAGVGAFAFALFHVLTHAFFKACLFLGSGSVIHAMHEEQDMRKMGGLRSLMPWTFGTFTVATIAITAVLPLSGFMSKDAILYAAFSASEHSGIAPELFAGLAKGLWGIGMLAAGLTSFYMWRLVFMTFFSAESGEVRAGPEVREKVHESPFSMVMPLVVLAILAVFGGLLGVPEALGGSDWIAHWLGVLPGIGHPPIPHGAEHSATTEYALMGVSIGVAWVGFITAWMLYGKGLPMASKAGAVVWLKERLVQKWHVDELYDAAIVSPLMRVSQVVLYDWVDRGLIDGIVNGTGYFFRGLARMLQPLQSGRLPSYLSGLVLALAVLLSAWYLGWLPEWFASSDALAGLNLE